MRATVLILILLLTAFEAWMFDGLAQAGQLPGDRAMAAGPIGAAGMLALAFNLLVLLPLYLYLRRRQDLSLALPGCALAVLILAPLALR
ncbi:hypothetical protein [Lysobacter silvisoli]|uniref:Uncharacterized protein n=1 Tax=Lysobacter silvisoli TaxID=2293254 RepID=A0A371JXW0_9GAMM|nr:hypothetical protein [Lysobacter silvisoli]RDZ26474.1 hypothetical protein DX914_15890 [Lysobacter silvisoli]